MHAESSVAERAAVHAALADPARLRIVDHLATGDASATELQALLGMSSNLLAHHLGVLTRAGLLGRHRSEADGRRAYVRLLPGVLDSLVPEQVLAVPRVVFVCTANSARSQLAAALWSRASAVPVTSAGTHPAAGVDEGARRAARAHGLLLPRARPRRLADIREPDDYVVTVCDRAHEELDGDLTGPHWSVPDPVAAGTPAAFDAAHDELSERVARLSPRLATTH
jgi:protein-tyrosine-phosphatase/DNA-binding HxlR family transcriptional regulator